MQLLRAARAACTKPHLRVTSIGSSFSLGPIFSTVATTWRETRLVVTATFSLSASINRNRMNVTSFERNYWSLQVKMFICDRGHTAVATVTAPAASTPLRPHR